MYIFLRRYFPIRLNFHFLCKYTLVITDMKNIAIARPFAYHCECHVKHDTNSTVSSADPYEDIDRLDIKIKMLTTLFYLTLKLLILLNSKVD